MVGLIVELAEITLEVEGRDSKDDGVLEPEFDEECIPCSNSSGEGARNVSSPGSEQSRELFLSLKQQAHRSVEESYTIS